MEDIKLSIAEKVESCFSTAENHFSRKLERPRISFGIKGQDAGRAYFPTSAKERKSEGTEICFNNYIMQNNPEKFVEQVVPHECAHLIVYEVFGTRVKAHGKEWKFVMNKLFSLEPNVRHDFEVANKPFVYRCSCSDKDIFLSKRQHQNILGGDKYLCRSCEGELEFTYLKKISPVAEGVEIKGLYLYWEEQGFCLNAKLLERLDKVISKNIVHTIYSSLDLSDNTLFTDWLRSKKLLRKYKGSLGKRRLLDEQASDPLISHAVLFGKVLDGREADFWKDRTGAGLLMRTIKFEY